MNAIKPVLTVALSVMGIVGVSNAQPFSSGSDGSYGAMNITNNTVLDLPPNGIFNCTTINVAPGVTLSFRTNAHNTPVYLLATSNVTIRGTINLSGSDGGDGFAGMGGPGGFDGGLPEVLGGEKPGDGYGPGGGKGGDYTGGVTSAGGGSYATTGSFGSSTNRGAVYGNSLLIPLIGGSGGGGETAASRRGGGGGGGALLIASNTRIDMTGAARANGGLGNVSPGSGGAVRLIAPVVAGNGAVETRYGLSVNGNQWAGNGRIRIDSLDTTGYQLNTAGGGVTTRGREMYVFPAVIPRLDIIEAAGQIIPEGAGNRVSIQLPANAATNQTVKLRARDFTGVVPIEIVVSPEYGRSTLIQTQVNMSVGNPADVTVNIVLPSSPLTRVTSRITAWSR